MTKQEGGDIAEALIGLKLKMNKENKQKWTDGVLKLPRTALSLRGAPPWGQVLRRQQAAREAKASENMHRIKQKEVTSAEPHTMRTGIDEILHHTLCCPSCKEWRDTSNKGTLRTRGGWAHIRCTACKVQSRACSWSCLCGKEWFRCKIHSDLDERKVKQKKSSDLSNRIKRKASDEPKHLHNVGLYPNKRRCTKFTHTNPIDIEATREHGR